MGFREFIRYRIEAGKRGFLGRAADDWAIALHPWGISIAHTDFRPFFPRGTNRQEIAWSDVARVIASQSDNYTFDTVWITFILGNGTSVSVPEVAEGWEQLIRQLPERLPNAPQPQDWLPHVTRTAFASNAVQLYPAPND
jgi:hypothetical protein